MFLKQEPPVISPDQRETMLTGLMEHKGFKSPKNPNGNVEVKDGFFDKDTLAELQDTHEAAIKSWISKSDDEKEAANDDLKYNNILIDKTSADLLKGSEVDYVEELIGNSFKINNPQTKSSCGCGVSFSL